MYPTERARHEKDVESLADGIRVMRGRLSSGTEGLTDMQRENIGIAIRINLHRMNKIRRLLAMCAVDVDGCEIPGSTGFTRTINALRTLGHNGKC